ncbi:MAG: hypothetical protein MUC57_18730 [Desulfobacterales bacterium]|nr:hypothetical protein [Desulfobacterales bacterium]
MSWFSTMRMGLWKLTAITALIISGCAGAPVDKTLQAEELLGTAGFQLKMADKPATIERISRIPQKQVVRGIIKDHEVYVWADAVGCRCYYAGTRQNYEQMLQIRQENQAQYRINLYDAQGHDPLWSNTADWEDDLLGRH